MSGIRSSRPKNCEPCRAHKLKCNRVKPCSECILRSQQHLCYPDGEPRSQSVVETQPNYMLELDQIRRSVAKLEIYFKSPSARATSVPQPDPLPASHDILIESQSGSGHYLGPTYDAINILDYIQAFKGGTQYPPYSISLPQNWCMGFMAILPSKPVLKRLVEVYNESATWNFRYIDRTSLNRMLSIYLETGCCDDAALATMFAICSIALYFLPWTDNLLHQFPDPASVTGDRFYSVCISIMEQSNSALLNSPSLELAELLLLCCHHLVCSKHSNIRESLWNLSGRLMYIVTTMGLHRDPSRWPNISGDATRRRWIFWNTITFERYLALLLSRPSRMSNAHFDTRFPMQETIIPNELVETNPFLHYMHCFRFSRVLGDIIDDIACPTPISPDRVLYHEKTLTQLEDEWPPDFKLDASGIARSLSNFATADEQRRGLQATHIHDQARFVRFALHRPSTIPTAPTDAFTIWSRDQVVNAAAFLIELYSKTSPNFSTNALLLVQGHTSYSPFSLFAACMFYCYELLCQPDHPDAGTYHENLILGINSYARVVELPIGKACHSILTAFAPRVGDDMLPESEESRRNRLYTLRCITSPFAGLPDHPEVTSA